MSILTSAPAERNKGPIIEVLQRVLPAAGDVLEIASGSGQHVEAFAKAMPRLRWLPSDPDPEARASVDTRIRKEGLTNVEPALDLDVLDNWAVSFVDAVVAANLLHISPQQTLTGLCQGAAEILRPGGILHVYGPFKRHGAQTSDSNAEFDRSLRSRNPAWGIRDMERLIEVAHSCGLDNIEINDMPANNFSLVFRMVR
jgi:SAM-dependent methyltransferase